MPRPWPRCRPGRAALSGSPPCSKPPAGAGALPTAPGVAAALPRGGASADAVSALQNLGFKPVIAASAVARALDELGVGAAEGDLIRVALKRAAG